MRSSSYDAVVVGAGPAGSVAALVLARGGARVALVDKAGFPRDKACGDLVGPRGVQALADLGVDVHGREVGDMRVLGPTGRPVLLRAVAGRTYPDHGVAVPRDRLDAHLREEAVAAGAEPVRGRVADGVGAHGPAGAGDGGRLGGVRLADGTTLMAESIIGADGATSKVADLAGLVDHGRVLWGFAVRAYVDDPVELPVISLWDDAPWHGFPGYGWLFPGAPGGPANVGLGLGMGAARGAGGRAARELDRFCAHLRRQGAMTAVPARADRRLGGWLKMGIVGTVPARGPVLLVGDAAGLVNPLQGEGISQAIVSGQAAAKAVLAGPAHAAACYTADVRQRFAPYVRPSATLHAAMVRHPRAVAAVGRAVTLPGVGRGVAGGWSVWWNDLLDGASPGAPARAAAAIQAVGSAVAAPSRTRRGLRRDLAGAGRNPDR